MGTPVLGAFAMFQIIRGMTLPNSYIECWGARDLLDTSLTDCKVLLSILCE